MFVCVFAKKFPALALQSCCEVSRPRAVGEYEYRLLPYRLFCFALSVEERITSSTILGSLDSKYLIKLNLYLDPVLQSPGRSRFVRCWHAKTDGWAASTFHSNCDGKCPTVTIVQVGSYVFGGYTDKSRGGMYYFTQMFSVFVWPGAKMILIRFA